MIKSNSMTRLFLLLSAIVLASSCSYKKNPQSVLKAYYADTSIFKIDTVFNKVLIGKKEFIIKVEREKFNNNFQLFNEPTSCPITILIINKDDGKIVYFQRITDGVYINCSMYKEHNKPLSSSGRLYLFIERNFGGSGTKVTQYFLSFNAGEFELKKLTESNELSIFYYNKNDKDILRLDGVWELEDGHFGNHRYKITKITFDSNGDWFQTKTIGETSLKYTCAGFNSKVPLLKDIQTKEPYLMKSEEISEYY